MPHVIVKLWPGRSEQQKRVIADRVIQAIIDSAGVAASTVTVGIEEIPKERWQAEVHARDIEHTAATIYRNA